MGNVYQGEERCLPCPARAQEEKCGERGASGGAEEEQVK